MNKLEYLILGSTWFIYSPNFNSFSSRSNNFSLSWVTLHILQNKCHPLMSTIRSKEFIPRNSTSYNKGSTSPPTVPYCHLVEESSPLLVGCPSWHWSVVSMLMWLVVAIFYLVCAFVVIYI